DLRIDEAVAEDYLRRDQARQAVGDLGGRAGGRGGLQAVPDDRRDGVHARAGLSEERAGGIGVDMRYPVVAELESEPVVLAEGRQIALVFVQAALRLETETVLR